MRPIQRVFLAALLVILLGTLLPAQSTPKKDNTQATTITRQQADEILQELRAIRQLLERQPSTDAVANELRLLRQVFERQPQPRPAGAPQGPPPPPQKVKLPLGDAPSLGAKDAPLVLMEYADYQCPYCRAFHNSAFAELKKNYIDTGKLRFVSLDLPLDFHNNALKAAQAARCAGEQNRFFEMRDLLIRNATSLGAEAVLGYAKQLSLDLESFKSCTAGDKYVPEIQKQAAEANARGISGTPSFVLGKIAGNEVDGVLLLGALPYAQFESQVKEMLAK